jgi:hypothetical protein
MKNLVQRFWTFFTRRTSWSQGETTRTLFQKVSNFYLKLRVSLYRRNDKTLMRILFYLKQIFKLKLTRSSGPFQSVSGRVWNIPHIPDTDEASGKRFRIADKVVYLQNGDCKTGNKAFLCHVWQQSHEACTLLGDYRGTALISRKLNPDSVGVKLSALDVIRHYILKNVLKASCKGRQQ